MRLAQQPTRPQHQRGDQHHVGGDVFGAVRQVDASELLDQAQEVLLKDLPAVPTWYRNAASGWSENVSNVTISWNGVPVYEDIEKN